MMAGRKQMTKKTNGPTKEIEKGERAHFEHTRRRIPLELKENVNRFLYIYFCPPSTNIVFTSLVPLLFQLQYRFASKYKRTRPDKLPYNNV